MTELIEREICSRDGSCHQFAAAGKGEWQTGKLIWQGTKKSKQNPQSLPMNNLMVSGESSKKAPTRRKRSTTLPGQAEHQQNFQAGGILQPAIPHDVEPSTRPSVISIYVRSHVTLSTGERCVVQEWLPVARPDPELDLLGIGDPGVCGQDDEALQWVAPTSSATLLLSTNKLHR